MGVRFRRRVRIAPGVNLNLSKSGLGFSAGPRGAKIGAGPRGGHFSLGIPGTGLSYRKDSIKPRGGTTAQQDREAQTSPTTVEISIQLHADGTVSIVDSAGEELPAHLIKQVRANHSEEIAAFLKQRCDALNAGATSIASIHHSTPAPDTHPCYEPQPFDREPPAPFVPQRTGLLSSLVPGRRTRIQQENDGARAAWVAARQQWESEKAVHETREASRGREFDTALRSDEELMEQVLAERLARLAWPRETLISFELRERGAMAWFDVDLPEVEDMPDQSASVAARGLKINIKKSSETQIRKDYMRFIHAILFRAIGEAFAALPALQEVVASGYTQRPDPSTGAIRDDYLVSTRAPRDAWTVINFKNLEAIDVIEAFERFELRRKMTKTGIFKPIEPFVSPST